MRPSFVAGCAAVCLTVSATAAAADPAPAQPTIGGDLLAARGVVVQPLAGTPTPPGGLSPSSWLVADADTGDVPAARDAHARHLPASTLKILTGVTLLPRLEP